MTKQNFMAVHCHYYQPPRGNPLSGEMLIEPSAAPYDNWNERITAECYEPNVRLGNVNDISFNVGESLASWLEQYSQTTYSGFIEADKYNVSTKSVGNGIAQPMHHTILPLSRLEDSTTQVKWGKQVFSHRFGRQSKGMWLPEMAVSLQTLHILREQGIEWTILTESQVLDKPAGGGPFWVDLGDDRRIKVFVRDEHLSNQLAFNLGHLGGAGRWARNVLSPYRQHTGELTVIASDGETFGHHWQGEEHFLHWLLSYEARAAGYQVVTLAEYIEANEPTDTIRIKEDTAWSSSYGLARWATGSPDTPGDSSWKGAVRRAMDNLRSEIDSIYQAEAKRVDAAIEPIDLRDAYVRVVLDDIPEEDFLKSQEVEVDKTDDGQRLLKLIEAQYYRQRMYASCAFFFSDLDDLSTRYGIASAAKALDLVKEATDTDLEPEFKADLRIATGVDKEGNTYNASEILEEVLAEIHA